MDEFSKDIDSTTFGIVRSYLNNARSPIRKILFVRDAWLIPRVAALLTGSDDLTPEQRRHQFTRWIESSTLSVGSHLDGALGTTHLDSVRDDATCKVLFLPPLYLVCLTDPVAPKSRNRPTAPVTPQL